jgi:hypothetical protein
VQQTVHTRALRRAVEILGSTEAVRDYLGVELPRLLLWLQGRATPPPEVFLRTVDLLLERKMDSLQTPLEFRMVGNVARCPKCDGTEFTPRAAGSKLDGRTELVCTTCGEISIHGDLIVRLGAEAAQRAAAGVARIAKQQKLKQTAASEPEEEEEEEEEEEAPAPSDPRRSK